MITPVGRNGKVNAAQHFRNVITALGVKHPSLKTSDALLLTNYKVTPHNLNLKQQLKVKILQSLKDMSIEAVKRRPDVVLEMKKIEEIKIEEIMTPELKALRKAAEEVTIETKLINLALSYGGYSGFKDIFEVARDGEIGDTWLISALKLYHLRTREYLEIKTLGDAKSVIVQELIEPQLNKIRQELAKWGIELR